MSRSSLLVRCLGFVLVFCQLLTPLNGGPIIGEDFSKETSYVSESVLSSPEPTTSLPSTSYSTTTKSPSTHQPSESSKKPTTQQPNVESSSYKTAHKTTPKKTEYEPNHSAPHKNDVYDRWGFEPKPTGMSRHFYTLHSRLKEIQISRRAEQFQYKFITFNIGAKPVLRISSPKRKRSLQQVVIIKGY